MQTRRRVIRHVVVLEPAGRLSDVVEDLDLAIQLALAEEPRGVVCDLSAVLADVDQVAVDVLATAGRHARNWPGTPVAMACADPALRGELAAHLMGAHLIVSPSLFSAISEVLAAPAVVVERLPLTPHPTAPRASRDFVTQVLRKWGLEGVITPAALVVSELAASSSRNVGTNMELSVCWNLGSLRLALRDHAPAHPHPHTIPRPPAPDLQGRGIAVAAGLSRTFGVLPAADGGQVVWAVLEAPRPQIWTRRARSGRAAGDGLSSAGYLRPTVFTDGRGPQKLPLSAGLSLTAASEPSATMRWRPHFAR